MGIVGVSHIWFTVDDLDEAEQFWSVGLGLPVSGRDEENFTVRLGGVVVGVHLPYPGMEGQPPSLRVNPTLEFSGDPHLLVAELRQRGVTALDPMFEDYGTVIQVFDPSSNPILLWQLNPAAG